MKKIFSRTSFFWLVNLIFMGVSVLHAGDFFGITGKDDFARYLGFAVSFFLDLVTIILMQAMLEARYRGEENRARQFLFFIVLCCGTSTFANLAMSLNDFNPTRYLPHAPEWVQVATPYILASFPLFVIMMSIAAEMIINVRPLEQLDEEEYEADEKKRLTIMEIRNTYLKKQVEQDLLAIQIRNQMLINKRQRMSAFSWHWQRQTEPQVAYQTIDIEAIISDLEDRLDARFKSFSHANEAPLQDASVDIDAHVDAHADAQYDAPIDLGERRSALHADAHVDASPEPLIEVKRDGKKDTDAAHKLTGDSAQMRRKVAGILKKNPDTTGKEMAKKTGLSLSQANRIKAQVLRDAQPDTAS